MELLKAYELPVAGTCGGMALCGSCHIQILNGAENLKEMGGIEEEMLATLPNSNTDSRLACQIRVSDELNGLELKILSEG